jgi:TP901 family phage tail tape measure protein
MNAFMNIQIRVLSADARKRIRELEAEVAMLRGQLAKTSTAMNTMGARGIQPITKWGNQVQWAGRQLQYNFTLPIILAGAAATKFALDNEKAMVRVKKVYGDGSQVMNDLATKEIPALEKSFIALSNRFGIAQDDAINIAADWAAAGASGVALARSVGLTMETMILGEMQAKEATEALIAIQAQYNFNTKELTETIDILNMVENQTGISMQGLVQGMARSAGVARSMGVDVQHLAAMMAALVPATGGAAAAGNGLKTILSRLMSPTNEANEVMAKMGINTKELAWQSLNATQRLEEMAKKYVQLDDAQKIVVASTAASRWQINRFGQLMSDINNPLGYYHRSLQATADTSKNFAQRQKELNTVLESSPQRLKQIWVMLQNALAKGIQPMIPALLIITNAIAKVTTWFANLSPAAQKFGLAMLFTLAMIGPVVRYMGSVAVLLGVLKEGFAFAHKWVGKFGDGLGKLVKGPFVLIHKAIVGIPVVLTKMLLAFGGAGAKAGRFFVVGFTKTMAGIGSLIVKLVSPIMGPLASLMTGIATLWGKLMVTMRGIWIRGAGFMTAAWGAFAQGIMTLTGALGVALSAMWQAIQKSLLAIQVFFARALQAVYMAILASQAAFVAAWAKIMAWGGKAWALLMPGKWLGYLRAALVAIPSLLMTVGGGIVTAIGWIGSAIWGGLAAIASWPALLIGLGIAAAIGILYNFKDQIAEIFRNIPQYFAENLPAFAKVWEGIASLFGRGVQFIIDMFWKLPEGVRNALLTVLRIVQAAVLKVYEWFSYLNPFAKHSPSLVEQVTKGMALIRDQYASVGNVGSVFAKAAADLAKYKAAMAALGQSPFADERSNVAANFASALPLFDALIGDLKALNVILASQAAAVAKQQAVVDQWEAALQAANDALDEEQAKLDSLQGTLDALNDSYAAHQQAMEDFASAPIQGMMEMEDQIFANQQAQNALRLEMLKWEEVNGSIDDITSNMGKLAGDMERLRGEEAALRAAGAGSDVLGPIQNEIAAMQAAYDAMGDTVNNSPVGQMQSELEALQRQGEILDLEKSLQFDGMIREIDKLANAQQELSFDAIIAGITAEKAAMAELEPQIAAATAAVEAQQAAVDAAKAARDAIQASYDAEKAKLDALTASYDKTEQAIRDIESALNDMGRAATEAGNAAANAASKGYQSPGAQNFDNAAGGNFPDVSGHGAQIGREGGLEDQSALIDQFTQDTVAEMEKTLGKIDMMGPIKEKWNQVTAWLEENIWSKLKGIGEDLKTIWNDLTSAVSGSGLGEGAGKVWDTVTGALSNVWDAAKRLYDLFKDDLKHILDVIVDAGKKIWDEIGPELAKFKDLIPGLTTIFGWLWNVIKVVAGIIGVVLVGAFKIVTSVLSHVLKPILDMIIGVFKNLIKVIRGIIEFVVGVFTGDWERAWQGIKDVVTGLFGAIGDIIKGAWNIIWGAVEGLINGIIDWFNWLWDELVGHSIIPDMIQAIVDWFKKLPQMVWDAIIAVVNFVIDVAQKMWDGFTDKSLELWNGFIDWVKGLAQAFWDKLIAIKDKIVDVAKKAWEAFKQANIDAWNTVITWLKDRAMSVWNNLIAIKDKIVDVAKKAWDGFQSKSVEVWGTVLTWLKGLPQAAWDKIIAIKDKLAEVGRQAFQALVDKAKDIVDGKNGFMTWITGLPGRIGGLLGKIGETVGNAIKAAWNGVAKWINDHGIDAVNRVTTKFGFTLSDLPTFAGGGVIPGKVSKKDNTIIAARTGEGVIVPELVSAMGGAKGLAQANRAAQLGRGKLAALGIEHFEDGGIIGSVTGWLKKGTGYALSAIIGAMKKPVRDLIPGKPFAEDWSVGMLQGWQDKAKAWGEAQDQAGNAHLPHIGYQYMEAVLRERFGKNIDFFSDFRPGAITALGNTSMHSSGRAVDMTPRKDIFDWIRGTYGKNTAQLFWSPEDGRTILRGQDWRMDSVTKAGHWDHIHWGYDKGGILPPGATLAMNRSGRNEYTLTAEQWATFSNVVALLDSMMLKSGLGATPGAAAVGRVGATLATVEARLRSAESRSNQLTTVGGGSGNTYNFYGDLEFPNVRSGEDAEDFLKHLKGLGG